MKKPEEVALERAKIQLIRIPNTVFYTSILFSLKPIISSNTKSWPSNIKTAATDGRNLYIHADFFLGLTDEERIGVLVHELLHVALNHMVRLGNRDPKIWNEAGDHVINLAISKTGKYQLPAKRLEDRRFIGMSTEQVYDILIKEAESNPVPVLIPGGEDIIYPVDPVEEAELEQDIKGILVKAATQAKAENSMPGDMPAEIEVLLQVITNPKLPWNVILQNYLSGFAKDDYSWQRPNRRYMPDYFLPSAFSESLDKVAIAVDASGSVSDEEFSYFIAEISKIQEYLKPTEILLIEFDTRIQNIQSVTQYTDIFSEIVFTGRGGTDITPVLDWAVEHDPEILLIFTDGYFHMPEEDHPSCPTVWLIHDNNYFESPFGEVITYEINR